MSSRRYPREAIHSLPHLGVLSDVADLPILVSERSLYILQNLVTLDAGFPNRYATALLNDGYIPVTEEDVDDWNLFTGVVAGLQLEVLEVPDLLTMIEQIRDNLASGVLRKEAFGPNISEFLSNLNAAAGTNYLQGGTVPSGEEWLIEWLNLRTSSTPLGYIDVTLWYGGNALVLEKMYPATPDNWYILRGPWTMPTGSYLKATFGGCALGDDLYFSYWGHQAFEVS